MNSIELNYAQQITFCEIMDALFIKGDILDLDVSDSCMKTIIQIIEATYSYIDDPEENDEYFMFKKVFLSLEYLADNEFNLLVSLNSLPKYFDGFKHVRDAIEKLLTIFIMSGHYEEISQAIKLRLIKEIKSDFHFVDAVLFSNNIISIRFKEFTEENVIKLFQSLMYRWFLHYDNPYINMKNLIK